MQKLKSKAIELLANARRFFREKGMYVALMGCLAAAALTTAVLFALNEPEGEDVNRSDDEQLHEAVQPTPALTPVLTPALTPAPTVQPTPIPDFTPVPTPSAEPTPKPARSKLSAPVSGEVLWEYAADRLVYSVTLKQWQTHMGVDLAAKLGEEVRAVAGGTVTAVYTDDALGFTVIIEHDNGHESVYANLEESDAVKTGQLVEKNQAIGFVGETALSECGLAAHVHFEYHVDGKPVDPEKHVYLVK